MTQYMKLVMTNLLETNNLNIFIKNTKKDSKTVFILVNLD